MASIRGLNVNQCVELCEQDASCLAWRWEPSNKWCKRLTSVSETITKPGYISGDCSGGYFFLLGNIFIMVK